MLYINGTQKNGDFHSLAMLLLHALLSLDAGNTCKHAKATECIKQYCGTQ